MHTPIRYQVVTSSRVNDPQTLGSFTSTTLETDDGDFVVTATGDIALATEKERAAQVVRSVISTYKGEAKVFNTRIYSFGTRIRDAVGKANTKHQRTLLAKQILYDLLDNNITPVNSLVEVLPLKEHIVFITFKVMVNGEVMNNVYKLDTMSGAVEDLGGTQI